MLVSSHTAQALDNASTKTRGCPIGLGDYLYVTTAEPATELPTVAEAAPATVVATAPTDLRRFLRRLAVASRTPTPEGSRPGFPAGDVPTPIHPRPGALSLAPPPFTRRPPPPPFGCVFPPAEV